jgi:hypothetical protein
VESNRFWACATEGITAARINIKASAAATASAALRQEATSWPHSREIQPVASALTDRASPSDSARVGAGRE